MSFVRIIATPSGEAPEEVRRAWIGTVIPLVPGHPVGAAATIKFGGVLTGPKSRLGRVLWNLLGRGQSGTGFVAEARACVEALERRDPAAASWWREHAPHVLRAGYNFSFDAESCEPVDALRASTDPR